MACPREKEWRVRRPEATEGSAPGCASPGWLDRECEQDIRRWSQEANDRQIGAVIQYVAVAALWRVEEMLLPQCASQRNVGPEVKVSCNWVRQPRDGGNEEERQ